MRAQQQDDPTSVRGDAGGLGGPLAGALFTTAILGAGRLATNPFPRPGSSPETIRTYYRESAPAARFNVGFQALSLLAQTRYVVAVARLATQSSTRPGLLSAGILLSGGAAVVLLATSAAIQESLTAPRERSDDEVLSTTRRVFVTGGPVHGVANGVLTAATVGAAREAGLLGRTGTALGLVSAAANLLSPAYFRWEAAGWLIPIGRFSSYLLNSAIGIRLTRGSNR